MDQKAVAFARSWATRYVRTKHPHGLEVEDVENRILESLYKYGRGKSPDGIDPDDDPAAATRTPWSTRPADVRAARRSSGRPSFRISSHGPDTDGIRT